MTARLPEEPVRVTSWLAGWVDYVFATVLVAGRWLAMPIRRRQDEPMFQAAFAPAMAEAFGPRWHDQEEPQQTSGLVKAAEIAMLSLSFFLAAHLLSGGTPTAVAPNLNPLGLLPEHARAQTIPVPAISQQITVTARPQEGAAPIATAAPAAPTTQDEPAAVLAPATRPETEAAAVPAPTVAETVTESPAPAAEAAPPPPAAAAAPPPAAPAAAPAATVPTGRVLSADEVRAAAVAAGWPAALVEQVVSVAWCESRFNSGASYLGAQGLMQILPFWWEPAGLDPAMWADPVANLKAALFAYLETERITGDPWSAWTCKPQ